MQRKTEPDPGGGVGGGVVWARTNVELEIDGPSSPSSSGYAGDHQHHHEGHEDCGNSEDSGSIVFKYGGGEGGGGSKR
ncbi:hypothetical protein FF1_014409 [Malus domestica]